jgi:hypothetical protein
MLIVLAVRELVPTCFVSGLDWCGWVVGWLVGSVARLFVATTASSTTPYNYLLSPVKSATNADYNLLLAELDHKQLSITQTTTRTPTHGQPTIFQHVGSATNQLPTPAFLAAPNLLTHVCQQPPS